MTTTARVSATKDSDITYTFNVADGASTTFATFGLKGEERVIIEAYDGTSYEPLTFRDSGGISRTADMTRANRVVRVYGPLDGRINKPQTAATVSVVEYS